MGWKARTVPLVIGLAVSAVLVWYLLDKVDLREFAALARGFSGLQICVGLVVYFGTYLLRALRWKVLLPREPVPLRSLVGITAIHTMTNNVFPSRTGELSYVYLVNRQHRVPIEEALASLYMVRIYDFVVVVVLFLLSLLLVRGSGEGSGVAGGFVLGAVLSLAVAVAVLLHMHRIVSFIVRLIERRAGAGRFGRRRFFGLLLEKGENAASYLRRVSSLRLRAATGGLSFAVWVVKFGSFLIMLGGILGKSGPGWVSFGYWKTVFGTTLAEVTTMLPVYSPLGIYEYAWTRAFVVVGMKQALAIQTGFAFHVLLILASALFAGLGSLWLSKRRSPPAWATVPHPPGHE